MRSTARLAALAILVSGCGYGHLQTARPTPRGAIDFTVGAGFLYNEAIEERRESPDGGTGVSISNLPLMLGARLGVHDRVDVGLRHYLLAGLLADTKINLLSPTGRAALSVSVGFGAARDIGSKKGYLLNLPLTLLGSYDVSKVFTPYVALGYSLFWIYGRDETPPDGVYYSPREGHGDHLLTAAAGIRLKVARRLDLFLEYNLWHPVVDDPGDFFSFTTSHIVIFGLRIRGRIFGGRRYEPPPLPLEPVSPGPPPVPLTPDSGRAPPPPPPPTTPSR